MCAHAPLLPDQKQVGSQRPGHCRPQSCGRAASDRLRREGARREREAAPGCRDRKLWNPGHTARHLWKLSPKSRLGCPPQKSRRLQGLLRAPAPSLRRKSDTEAADRPGVGVGRELQRASRFYSCGLGPAGQLGGVPLLCRHTALGHRRPPARPSCRGFSVSLCLSPLSLCLSLSPLSLSPRPAECACLLSARKRRDPERSEQSMRHLGERRGRESRARQPARGKRRDGGSARRTRTQGREEGRSGPRPRGRMGNSEEFGRGVKEKGRRG